MTLRAAFLYSVLLAIAAAIAILVGTGPMIVAGPLEPFDTRTGGYTLGEARAYLAALTPEGRAAYLGPQRIADTLFPIGLLGLLALGPLLALRPVAPRLGLAFALPALGYFVFDMLENAAVAGMLGTEPAALTAETVARASFYTVVKFRLVWLAIGLFALSAAIRYVKERRA